MQLNLKDTPVAAKSAQVRTKRALDLLLEVQELVKRMGLPEMPKPEHRPLPLADLDTGALSNRELETQMTTYVAFAQYIGPKLAEAEAAYKISDANLKTIKASLKVDLFKDKVPKTEIDARVACAPAYAEQELEHLKVYATKEVLKAYYKSFSRQAQALSRIVEMRKLEFEQEQRQNSVANHRAPRGGLPGRFRR